MKKIFALSLVLVLILSLFAGCGKNPLIGKWEGKADMTEAMVNLMKEQLGSEYEIDPDPIYIYCTIALNEDGTYAIEVDKDKTMESIMTIVDSMKDIIKEEIYKGAEAQGISREDADAVLESSLGMSIDEYIDSNMGDIENNSDLEMPDFNETGTFEIKDSTLTLHPEDDEDETITFKLDGSKLTLTFELAQMDLDDDTFAGMDQLEFVMNRVN